MHRKYMASDYKKSNLARSVVSNSTNDITDPKSPRRLAPSFSRALIVNVVGLVVILELVLLSILTWQGISTTKAAAQKDVSESLNQITRRLSTLISAAEMTANSAERVARAGAVNTTTLRPILEGSLAAFEQRPELSYLGIVLPDTGEYGNIERTVKGDIFLWLFPGTTGEHAENFLLKDNGFHPYATYPANGYDPRNRPFYQAALKAKQEGTWIPAYKWIDHSLKSNSLWGISYVRALRDHSGKVIGVIDTDLDLSALGRFINALSTEYRAQIYLVEMGVNPRLIAAPNLEREPLPPPPELSSLIKNSGETLVTKMTFNGENRWVASHRFETRGVSWAIIASRAAPVIEAPLRQQLVQVFGMGLALALGLLLISIRMARRFGKPLAELEQRVASLGKPLPEMPVANVVSAAEGFRETQLLDKALERMSMAIRQQVLAKEQQMASIRLKGAIFDFTSAIIFSIDQEFKVVEWNAAAERQFGLSRREVIGRAVGEVIFAPEGSANWDNILQMKGKVFLRLIGANGIFDTELRRVTFSQDDRKIHTFVLNDITAQKHMEQRLRQERDYADAVLNSLPGVFYHYDERIRLVRWNKNFELTSGYSPQELEGADPMTFFADEEKDLVKNRIIEVLDKGESSVEADYLLRDGRRIPYLFTGVRFEHNGSLGFVGVGTDITERKKTEQRIRFLALYDELTGLPNRNLIQDQILQSIAQARHHGHYISLLYLDLDRFKVVNEGYGHLFGNAVLKSIGEKLVKLLHEVGSVSRLSGDEFLILLPGLDLPAKAEIVARNIIENFQSPILVEGIDIHLSLGIGISVYPPDGETPEVLIANADMAMTRAKARGQNAYQFFTREMRAETQYRVDLEIKLRNAVAEEQLRLVYQPKVNLKSGIISGCEALVRWHHPELGIISPAHFIPIAEESGLIVSIGDWVLRTACKQARAWRDAGLSPVPVAVNISVRQFLQQDVVAWVARTLEDTGLPPEWLELELTESMIAQDIEKVTETINQLKEIGVKLSIDDFGTGYSSLNYLKRFRVDTLKIDQSFVRNMLNETEDSTIVLAVIALAHNLKFKVIAEGVETEEHCRYLQINNCDEIQGYFFSKPIMAMEFEAMLRSGRQLTYMN